ncbi:MAG: TatD family hydrolase [Acidimicrobiia bacterium]
MAEPSWVDTHGHLFLLDEPSDAVLARAQDAGVGWLVCPGIDVESSEASRDLAALHPGRVRWSAGLHPHSADSWPDVEERISQLAAEAAAVGECGLDWYRELAPRHQQIEAFGAQLKLAGSLGKPIIVHCRDAFREVFDALEEAALGELVVLHCWTGGPRWTRRFNDLGVSFSFAGPITYSTADSLRLGAEQAPPERSLVETDSPYLTPEPKRSESNEPANVHLTGAALASVWGTDVETVAAMTTANADRIFGAPDGG